MLLHKLKDRIECPVCYEIPVAGPVYSCVNGHLVCTNCKRDSCPTCRENIQGKSLLAADVIVSIEHKCKNVECDQLVAYNSIEKHAKECKFRTIRCPAYSCREIISLPKMSQHILEDCEYSAAREKGFHTSDKSGTFRFNLYCEKNWNPYYRSVEMETFMWEGNFFFFNWDDDFDKDAEWNFYVSMLESETALCRDFTVEISMHRLESIFTRP